MLNFTRIKNHLFLFKIISRSHFVLYLNCEFAAKGSFVAQAIGEPKIFEGIIN